MADYLGLNTAIVATLKKYGTPLPVDYLASVLGRRESDIEDYLRSLEVMDVIKRTGNIVSLVPQERYTDKEEGNLVNR